MGKHKITNITNTGSLTEISRGHLNSFFNSSSSKPNCSSKCKTIKSTSSSSSSSSSCSSKSSKKHKSRKHKSSKGHKSKCVSSTYTTTGSCTTSSSSCPTNSSSSCCPTNSSSSCCPTNSSSGSCSTNSSSCSKSSKSCSPCKTKCPSYALKCNTYKNLNGTILIPGPQGQSSSSLANFSGINNEGNIMSVMVTIPSLTYIYFTSSNMNYVNIIPSTTSYDFDTFTFNLSGKYLFQYNVNVSVSSDPSSIEFTGKVNGVTSVVFGTQTINSTGNYGCSIIQNLTAGDYISLVFTSVVSWSFASLTIIKL